MGYYINILSNGQPLPYKGKVKALIENEQAKVVDGFLDMAKYFGPGKMADLVAVVDNGPFEAAAYLFSLVERQAFGRPDDARPLVFLELPLGRAAKLSGYEAATNSVAALRIGHGLRQLRQ